MIELFKINFMSDFFGKVLTGFKEMGCWKVAQSLTYYQLKFALESAKRRTVGCCSYNTLCLLRVTNFPDVGQSLNYKVKKITKYPTYYELRKSRTRLSFFSQKAPYLQTFLN